MIANYLIFFKQNDFDGVRCAVMIAKAYKARCKEKKRDCPHAIKAERNVTLCDLFLL